MTERQPGSGAALLATHRSGAQFGLHFRCGWCLGATFTRRSQPFACRPCPKVIAGQGKFRGGDVAKMQFSRGLLRTCHAGNAHVSQCQRRFAVAEIRWHGEAKTEERSFVRLILCLVTKPGEDRTQFGHRLLTLFPLDESLHDAACLRSKPGKPNSPRLLVFCKQKWFQIRSRNSSDRHAAWRRPNPPRRVHACLESVTAASPPAPPSATPPNRMVSQADPPIPNRPSRRTQLHPRKRHAQRPTSNPRCVVPRRNVPQKPAVSTYQPVINTPPSRLNPCPVTQDDPSEAR